MARDHVVAWGHDVNRNLMCRANASSTLDIKTYQVAFAGGIVMKLMINVIAESI